MTGNVFVAVLFNVARMILAALGFITPVLAIGFMVLSIFAILLNTLRIRGVDLQREELTESGLLAATDFGARHALRRLRGEDRRGAGLRAGGAPGDAEGFAETDPRPLRAGESAGGAVARSRRPGRAHRRDVIRRACPKMKADSEPIFQSEGMDTSAHRF